VRTRGKLPPKAREETLRKRKKKKRKRRSKRVTQRKKSLRKRNLRKNLKKRSLRRNLRNPKRKSIFSRYLESNSLQLREDLSGSRKIDSHHIFNSS
jgi:hypothetical protein